MKIGDYVRTKNGYIGKIYNINEFREPSMMYAIDISKADDFIFMSEKDFKSRPNIIDLIEVGDYVNGYKVSFKDKDIEPFVQCDYPVQYGTTNHYRFNERAIYSIVTKERFEIMEYKVVE